MNFTNLIKKSVSLKNSKSTIYKFTKASFCSNGNSNKTTPDVKNDNSKQIKYKEDITEDLNRLGNDWKSDPNQQEEARVGQEEYEEEQHKRESKEKDNSNKNKKSVKNLNDQRPEDMYVG